MLMSYSLDNGLNRHGMDEVALKHLDYKKKIISIWENPPIEITQQFDNEPYTKHVCNLMNQNIFDS